MLFDSPAAREAREKAAKATPKKAKDKQPEETPEGDNAARTAPTESPEGA